ncbi:DUF1194 domain-containing protein [Pelagovum pacificum]|uniref:DUF1194 domain-containing protein n=1 Tax=Pelagovum pacificum TaxID=2588711 RepID=A0A5C5GFQ1_9RHOB|nr:DUF1194 domain-containing protein [Pelagovum pacificum]QQA43280.1 DUF1194 domain-containing protein [Pelagovum pacificum]TNY33582.1 DUF1194 domain-containing protein [Pelagovum pacificum]
MSRLVLLFWLLSTPARACDTALLLMMDVSNSIDPAEFRLQTDGLADALIDPEVSEALVQGQVALTVVQWSGPERQEVSLPWTIMATPADVVAYSQQARSLIRAFVLSDTAPAEALRFAFDHMDRAPDCERQIIDVSGDGTPNAGTDVRGLAREAQRRGITVNGIAIEGMGLTITNFYRRAIITRDGFVITARGHREYPDAIRRKILREISRVFGKL